MVTTPSSIWLPNSFGFGGALRSFWPSKLVPRSRVWTGMLPLDGSVKAPDVLVVHRTFEKEEALAAVHHFRSRGSRIVLQEDDDLRALLRVSRDNGYRSTIPHPGLISTLARMADRVICTTPTLADYYSGFCSDVLVLRNYLPSRYFHPPVVITSSADRRVVYGGTVQSHAWDLDWLAPATDKLSYPFRVIGGADVHEKLGTTGESSPWISSADRYYSELRRSTIGIVPLQDNDFNRSKSWLKALDYSASGLAVVASDSPENVELSKLVPAIELVSSPEELVEAIGYATPVDGSSLVELLSLEAHRAEWIAAICD